MFYFWAFLWLLFVHWVADFVLQSHWMAINKSKSNEALGLHVAVYTVTLYVGMGFLVLVTYFPGGAPPGFAVLKFVALNGILHFATDYVTSRITSRLYAKQDFHNFFVVIGIDQFIHQMTLAATLYIFV